MYRGGNTVQPTPSEYNGYGTVTDPRQYLDAPAMIMLGSEDTGYGQNALIHEAMDTCKRYNILNADDLHGLEAELSVLQTRIGDVAERLDVEHKMKEAASSLSKLHINGSDDNRSSIVEKEGHAKRLSRIFSGTSPIKNSQRRLSRQAEDEAQVSIERIKQLEETRSELLQRQFSVERAVLQHHSAVLALMASGQPIPEVPPSENKGLRNLTGINATTGLRSAIEPHEYQKRSGHHKSQSSVSLSRQSIVFRPSSMVSLGSPLQSPKQFYDQKQPHQHIHSQLQTHRRGSSQASSNQLLLTYNEEDRDQKMAAELDSLASRIAAAMPSGAVTPSPNKIDFLQRAFMKLLRDVEEHSGKAEAYHSQAQQAEDRVKYLTGQLRRIDQNGKNRSLSGVSQSSMQATDTSTAMQTQAEISSLRQAIQIEKSLSSELRSQNQAQRDELARVVASLEDVTQLAVGYEAERAEYIAVVKQLESQVQELTTKQGELQSRALAAKDTLGPGGASILCKEFQKIIGELHAKQYRELRELRSARVESATKDMNYPRVQEPSSLRIRSPGVPSSRRQSVPNEAALLNGARLQERSAHLRKSSHPSVTSEAEEGNIPIIQPLPTKGHKVSGSRQLYEPTEPLSLTSSSDHLSKDSVPKNKKPGVNRYAATDQPDATPVLQAPLFEPGINSSSAVSLPAGADRDILTPTSSVYQQSIPTHSQVSIKHTDENVQEDSFYGDDSSVYDRSGPKDRQEYDEDDML